MSAPDPHDVSASQPVAASDRPAPQPNARSADLPGSGPRQLILVAGAGRSGTSSIAGALNMLGYYVPQPVLEANESNPRGFFEPTWTVRFHRRLLDAALVEQTDGRRSAVTQVRKSVTPGMRTELRTWLAEQFTYSDRVVVKDPRSAWVPWLWEQTAKEVGVPIGYITMLRRPAEVVGSRATHYAKDRGRMKQWNFDVKNLCGWIAMNLAIERQTRSTPRVWIDYPVLVQDWRSQARRVRDVLGAHFDVDLEDPTPNAVDAFIDPTLRRHTMTLADLDMPTSLSQIAEDLWDSTRGLVAGDETGVAQRLDEIAARYDRLLQESLSISHHARLNELRVDRRKTETEVREAMLKQAAQQGAAEQGAAEQGAAEQRAADRADAAPPGAPPRTGGAPSGTPVMPPMPTAVQRTLRRIPRSTRRRLQRLLDG